MDRGAWRATARRVAKNLTQLKVTWHACTHAGDANTKPNMNTCLGVLVSRRAVHGPGSQPEEQS